MALPILDGNQSATTLSTILSSGQHITAHTVVSLGTQAITDISGAVSGSVVSISNFPATQTIAGTVTAFGEDTVSGGFLPIPLNDGGEAVLVDIKGAFGSGVNVPISGTVTAVVNCCNARLRLVFIVVTMLIAQVNDSNSGHSHPRSWHRKRDSRQQRHHRFSAYHLWHGDGECADT
jgi:hypothetical protein